jgi:hypothetical protein
MTTITDDNGEIVTRVNVMQILSYDVEQIVQQLREDNRVGDNDSLELTLDDVLERIANMVEDDFGYTAGLIYQDQDGNDI